MTSPRTASALCVTRRNVAGHLEVLLVERSPKLRFFGGYWAFPGGTIDVADHEVSGNSEEKALQFAAVRELFEETGFLPDSCRGALTAKQRKALRHALLMEDPPCEPWMDFAAARPTLIDGVRPFCRITTPEFAPVRYATLFVHLDAPEDSEVDIWPGELVAGRFWRPEEAIDAWRHGDLLIVPPVLFLLRLLDGAPDLESFLTKADQETKRIEEGSLHPIYFVPGTFVAPLKAQTKPPATTTNCMIIGGETKFIVDPGSADPEELKKLDEKLNALVGSQDTLEGVILTHHHPDHIAGATHLVATRRLPVYAHPKTLDRLTGFLDGAETRPLIEGDTLSLGTAPDGSSDWTMEAWHTPGHAPGHIALIESRYRSAIVGDLLSVVSTIVIDPEDGHLATYLDSLRRFLPDRVGCVHPGHGPAWRDGIGLIERFLKHRQKREDLLVGALTESPKNLDELVEIVYADTDPRAFPLAKKSLEAGLIKLEEEGRAKPAGSGWVQTS